MHSREELEAMKRADLQRLCKDHGIKANLKTESLIDHLLIASSPEQVPSPSPQHAPQPAHTQRTPSMRVVSRAVGGRTRSQSDSSVVVHSDSDHEMEDAEPKPSPAPAPLPIPITRTRKAKDTQLRLGVGRPAAAGGSGARAVTKPLSVGRSKRGKVSRSIKPSEDTIPEEETSSVSPAPSSVAGPSNQRDNMNGSSAEERSPAALDSTDIGPIQDILRSLVDMQIQPLQHTVSTLQLELQQRNLTHRNEVNALNERIDGLTNEVQEYRRRAEAVDFLRTTIEQLQADLGRLRSRSAEPLHEPMNLSTPVSIPSSSPPHPSEPGPSRPTIYAEHTRPARASRSSPIFEYPPPPARSPTKKQSKESAYRALGKRPRGADEDHIAGTVEAGREGELSDEELRKTVLRPSKKRAKLEQDSTDDFSRATTPYPPVAGPSSTSTRARAPPAAGPSSVVQSNRLRGFSVFEGPEERSTTIPSSGADDEVFTDRDFDFFDSAANFHPPRAGGHHGPITSTANAIENQPFPFVFPSVSQVPLTSTPTTTVPIPSRSDSPILSAFPFPEPPHSPSPAPTYGHHRGAAARNDLLRPFGPPDGSVPSGSSTHPSDSAAALLRTPPPTIPDLLELEDSQGRRKASSNDVGAGLGMTALPMRMSDTLSGPARRTMYGTELEGDTRFGDFGVEGVASGFWAGGRF